MLVFLAMYALLAVEYYRFVYLNYYYLMGFDFVAAPVPILVGLLMLAVVTIVMFGKCDAVSGKCEVASANYAVSMIVALLFCLPSIVMYQFGRVTPMVALYSMLFLILLRTPLLKVGRWNLPHVPVKYQRYLLPTICLLCLLWHRPVVAHDGRGDLRCARCCIGTGDATDLLFNGAVVYGTAADVDCVWSDRH